MKTKLNFLNYLSTKLKIIALRPSIFLGLACAADTDFILIAGGFDGINRLSSAEILRIGSAHTVNVEPMPIPRFKIF